VNGAHDHSTLAGLPRRDVVGLACTLTSADELAAALHAHLATADPSAPTLSLLCVNAHIHNLACDDPGLRQWLGAADVLALDGMSMVWAARRSGATGTVRCNMTEALRAFLGHAAVLPQRALVIGLDEGAAARAGAAINNMSSGLRVIQTMDGYRDVAEYRDAVLSGTYDIVLVGCGTPRSEAIIAEVAATGRPALAWHVGGGTLRFLAGDDREAPVWMRRSGLQWLHRLLRHPRDLWRRYLVGLPIFAGRVLRHPRRETSSSPGPANDGP
jgi:N-acetylglucosaminyldiphosphoundecaprenol N-acetyl-beta-D-mannosaminyltransferase